MAAIAPPPPAGLACCTPPWLPATTALHLPLWPPGLKARMLVWTNLRCQPKTANRQKGWIFGVWHDGRHSWWMLCAGRCSMTPKTDVIRAGIESSKRPIFTRQRPTRLFPTSLFSLGIFEKTAQRPTSRTPSIKGIYLQLFSSGPIYWKHIRWRKP